MRRSWQSSGRCSQGKLPAKNQRKTGHCSSSSIWPEIIITKYYYISYIYLFSARFVGMGGWGSSPPLGLSTPKFQLTHSLGCDATIWVWGLWSICLIREILGPLKVSQVPGIPTFSWAAWTVPARKLHNCDNIKSNPHVILLNFRWTGGDGQAMITTPRWMTCFLNSTLSTLKLYVYALDRLH